MRVFSIEQQNSTLHVFQHGTTWHGLQIFEPRSRRLDKFSYYHEEGSYGDIFRGLHATRSQPMNLGIIGLGAGTLACYGRPTDAMTYYEIDPEVEVIARNPALFTYLKDCPLKPDVVIGDARLTIRNTPDGKYDLLTVDAFSSDAIPVHLLTQEALDLYLKKIKPDGLIAFHISNRYLDLSKVIANYQLPAGYVVYFRPSESTPSNVIDGKIDFSRPFKTELALIGKQVSIPEVITESHKWKLLTPAADFKPWTDDYSNIFSVLRFSKKTEE